MTNPNFDKNDDIKRQTRTVYLIMAVSLAVLAILITVSVISARRSAAPAKEDISMRQTETEKTPADTAKRGAAEEDVRAKSADTVTETADAAVQSTEDIGVDAEPKDVLPDFAPVTAGAIIKGYSVTAPVYSQTMDDYRVHTGVDIAAELGSNVYAAASGTIGAVWEDPMNGCSLTINHSGGAVSTYSNLSRETLDAMKPGMVIKGGMVVGTVGDTSLVELADEAHVHYELAINGVSVDPAEYMDFSQNRDNYAE